MNKSLLANKDIYRMESPTVSEEYNEFDHTYRE